MASNVCKEPKTKREKLSEAYKLLKQGYTLEYKTGDYNTPAMCWIDKVHNSEAIDYGKEYIFWRCFGSSANKVSLKEFKWILDVIFKVKDYSDFVLRTNRY